MRQFPSSIARAALAPAVPAGAAPPSSPHPAAAVRSLAPAALAYARAAREGLSGRALEAAVLSRCANALAAALGPEEGRDPATLVRALADNQRCWSILGRAAARADTHLPPDLARSVQVMAAFVHQRTLEVLDGGDPAAHAARIAPLVDIDRWLAAGLRGEAA